MSEQAGSSLLTPAPTPAAENDDNDDEAPVWQLPAAWMAQVDEMGRNELEDLERGLVARREELKDTLLDVEAFDDAEKGAWAELQEMYEKHGERAVKKICAGIFAEVQMLDIKERRQFADACMTELLEEEQKKEEEEALAKIRQKYGKNPDNTGGLRLAKIVKENENKRKNLGSAEKSFSAKKQKSGEKIPTPQLKTLAALGLIPSLDKSEEEYYQIMKQFLETCVSENEKKNKVKKEEFFRNFVEEIPWLASKSSEEKNLFISQNHPEIHLKWSDETEKWEVLK
tara:strand:- start:355 stop:1209 length:855 start_codon:yes stop_codon:yes gene_type:complete